MKMRMIKIKNKKRSNKIRMNSSTNKSMKIMKILIIYSKIKINKMIIKLKMSNKQNKLKKYNKINKKMKMN